MIREEVGDVSDIGAQGKKEGREPDTMAGSREEPEAPRAELPEWLAKELFKIFV